MEHGPRKRRGPDVPVGCGGADPALFDELWALLLARLGDVEASRDAARRLVADALVVVDDRVPASVSG